MSLLKYNYNTHDFLKTILLQNFKFLLLLFNVFFKVLLIIIDSPYNASPRGAASLQDTIVYIFSSFSASVPLNWWENHLQDELMSTRRHNCLAIWILCKLFKLFKAEDIHYVVDVHSLSYICYNWCYTQLKHLVSRALYPETSQTEYEDLNKRVARQQQQNV